jgi:hypothetical protein
MIDGIVCDALGNGRRDCPGPDRPLIAIRRIAKDHYKRIHPFSLWRTVVTNQAARNSF